MYNLVKLITRLIYFRNKIDDHRYLKDILKLITALLSAVLFTYLYCLFLWIKNIFAFELEIKLPLAILILSLFFLGRYYLIVVKLFRNLRVRVNLMDKVEVKVEVKVNANNFILVNYLAFREL